MRNFKELTVWNKSIELVVLVYKLTSGFPKSEDFGLTSQMRRAAVSIPSNIAEGHMRTTTKDFKQFLAIARGSCAELETQGIIAHRLGYLSRTDFESLMSEIETVARMSSALYSKL
ncbi:MAG: four helix bundle protein [Patescibacteria group bacterium]